MAPPNELSFGVVKGEKSRTYHYGDGTRFTVGEVNRICVRPSGNHRLETSTGRKYIIKEGWVAIEIIADNWSL